MCVCIKYVCIYIYMSNQNKKIVNTCTYYSKLYIKLKLYERKKIKI